MTLRQKIIKFLFKEDIPYQDLMPNAKEQVDRLEKFIQSLEEKENV